MRSDGAQVAAKQLDGRRRPLRYPRHPFLPYRQKGSHAEHISAPIGASPRSRSWPSCPWPGPRSQVEPATLVLRNGHIATVDDAKPQAQALAARGDTLVAVGTNEEIAPYIGPADEA